jgi:dephospho-CoA kinase
MRIAAQMPLEAKQNFAQTVIRNDSELDEFREKVRVTFAGLLKQEPHA